MTPTGDRDLDALLAAAGAPAFPEEQDEQALQTVLAAFDAAGSVELAGAGAARGRPARPKRRMATMIARCAAALCVVTGSGVAVASAGILPMPVQSLAHHIFGGIGVPAPKTGGTSRATTAVPSPTAAPTTQPGHVTATTSPTVGPSITATATANTTTTDTASASSAPASPSGQDTTTLLELCGQVIGHGDGWETGLSQQDLAVLTAAADGEDKIVPYCAHLLKAAHEDTATTTTPAPPSTPANAANGASSGPATPSADATTAQGNGKGKDKGGK